MDQYPFFNEEFVNKLINKGEYLNVTPDTKGKITSSRTLSITGSKNRWNKFPDTVYLPDVRLAGNPENVRNFMNVAEYNDTEINNSLRNAYTKSNTSVGQNMHGNYDIEWKNAKRARTPTRASSQRFAAETDLLENLTNELKQGLSVVPSPRDTTTKKVRTPSTGRAGGRSVESFSARISKLPIGRMLNVSKVDNTGRGARTIIEPKNPRKLIVLKDLKLVSSTTEGLENALDLLVKEKHITASDKNRYLKEFKSLSVPRVKKSAVSRGKKPAVSRARKPAVSPTVARTSPQTSPPPSPKSPSKPISSESTSRRPSTTTKRPPASRAPVSSSPPPSRLSGKPRVRAPLGRLPTFE
uniref:Uncharacterized protein n=1 Tax=Pithovirus LCPAC104 TaxID=2506589 RepID=A0A481Z6F3_9VIRU|nr:MAG: hypothetical protein LCPAC104_01670 [Pithovirus LCPAC104]